MVTVLQSPSDKKSYRHFQLPNGLTVLLIHDPTVAAGLQGGTQEGGDVAMREADGNEGSGSDSEGSGSEEGSSEGGSGSSDEGEGSSSDDEGEGEEDEEEGGAGGRGKKRRSGGAGPAASKKAAAALAVGVGSFADPPAFQGLAHYLEHMLFMGSAKYPDENEYDAYLNKHGGSSNAYTELEYTNYHFDVSPAHLEGALDRLAQFFVEPLFLAGSLEREVQAVDSEFKGVQQSDHSRLAQLMCHTCKAGHVYNKFSWGNLLSLWEQPRAAGLDVRQHIIDFYRRHYSAARMSLVVLGGQDLDTLQAWVEASFGPIPTGTAGPPASYEDAGMPFEGPPCLYVAPAVSEQHEVTVTFQLPCLRPNYANKPEHYISHLLGHEGPGSLLSALKTRGWAVELCAGIDDDGYSFNTAAYLFTVNIVLTEAGLAAGPGCGLAPVALLFSYMQLITTTGPQSWVYDELRAISDMKFRFMEEEDSCDFVTRLAATMGWVEPQHLLAADYLHHTWQPDRVLELLGRMQASSSNYRIDLLTKSFAAIKEQLTQQQQQQQQQQRVTPLHEPWFNMEAVRWQLPDDVISGWASADVSADLALPPPNPYVPTDFTLKGTPPPAAAAAGDGQPDKQQQQQQQQPQQQEEIAGLPRWVLSPVGGRPSAVGVLLATPPDLLLDTQGVRLWHKLALRYQQPRLVTYWRLSSPVAASSPRASVLCALWLRLVEEALAEEAYLADVAGLHWSSCPEGVSGLEVRLDGFSHKLALLAAKVFNALATAQVKASSFPAVSEALMRRYKNALLKPSHAANALRLQLLSGSAAWSYDQLAQALARVKGVEEVQAFASSFLSRCHLEALMLGNAAADDATRLCSDVAAIINNAARQPADTSASRGSGPPDAAHPAANGSSAAAAGGQGGGDRGLVLGAAERPVEVCVQLPAGREVLLAEAARNPEEDNCAVEVYYQVGLSSSDLRLRVLTDLVEQVVSEALYDTLRTKQQLGYTVSSGARLTHGVTGFCVVVVSAAFDAPTVEARVEAFLADFQATTLKAMSPDEFARHKSSLASNKLQSDTSLGQEGDRAWEQVFTTRYEFVTREQEAAVLQELTLQDLQSFYAQYISPASPSRRKLCVHVNPLQKGKQQQGGQEGGGYPQEHVQHEFGVIHPQGKHTQHAKQQHAQHQQQQDEGPAAAAAAAEQGNAAGGGGGDTPKSKRVRRGGSSPAAGGGVAPPVAAAGAAAGAGLAGVQVAPVEVLSGGVDAFRATAARYEAYTTVQPEPVVQQG